MFQDLNPLDKTTAVLEIVIMLVVAFAIGILTSWLARKKNPVVLDNEKVEDKEQFKNEQVKINELNHNLSNIQQENNQLKSQLSGYQNNASSHAIEVEDTAKLKEKIMALQAENKKITVELHEHEKLNYELKHKLKRPAPKFSSHKEAADALGFKLASVADKEDLTIIKGIGPFIQEKLNELGIYTIEQISDFTINTVINVTEAIEYFPGRIQRDFWVEQANQILNERASKS